MPKTSLKTDQKNIKNIYDFWMDFGVAFGSLLVPKFDEKNHCFFDCFFGWILDDFWDVFWEPNRIKKSMEFMTPFSVNFYGFWTTF